MDSKTRVLTALSHEKPDRAPFNFWMDRRLMARYEQRIGHRHWRVTHFGADVIETFAHLPFPVGPGVERDGTRWQTGPYLESWDDAEGITMPNPYSDEVYALMDADLKEFPDKAIFLDLPTPWGVMAGIRTYELIYMDMHDHPEEIKAFASRIADVQKVAIERACEKGITALYLMEDLATAQGLSMAPAMIQEFCLDLVREQSEIACSRGVPVLFHSDGMIMDLIDLLIPLGICAVNPLQPHLNDLAEFNARYGDKVALYGGLDNCYVIPDDPPAKIREHVLHVFHEIGSSDGALIFSTHDIPLHTPEENVETMIRTIKEECVYGV